MSLNREYSAKLKNPIKIVEEQIEDVDNNEDDVSSNQDPLPMTVEESVKNSSQIKVQITQASLDSELEKTSVHSGSSYNSQQYHYQQHQQEEYQEHLKPNLGTNEMRRHSLPAIAFDKMKSIFSGKPNHHQPNVNSNVLSVDSNDGPFAQRKNSLIELFTTIGSNLGLVSPKRSISHINGGLGSTPNDSNGSLDLQAMRSGLGIVDLRGTVIARSNGMLVSSSGALVPGNIGSGAMLTSTDEIYYRPHRTFLRDLLCCVCFKKHDEYDNLIESHSCARVFTALVLVTIACMLIGYIVKAASETESNQPP